MNIFRWFKKNKKTKKNNIDIDRDIDDKVIDLIYALGGLGNIINISSSSTRLIAKLKNTHKINSNDFKKFGSNSEFISKNNVEIFFGNMSHYFANEINNIIDNKLPLIQKQKIEIQPIQNNVCNNSDLDNSCNEPEILEDVSDNDFLPFNIYSPVDGFVYYLSDLNDVAFKNNILGQGIAIKPKSPKYYCPLNEGKIISINEALSCYVFESADKTKVLMYAGTSLIKLDQSPFEMLVKNNCDANIDIHLINSDLNKLDISKNSLIPIVVPNLNKRRRIEYCVKNRQVVKKGEILFKVV